MTAVISGVSPPLRLVMPLSALLGLTLGCEPHDAGDMVAGDAPFAAPPPAAAEPKGRPRRFTMDELLPVSFCLT